MKIYIKYQYYPINIGCEIKINHIEYDISEMRSFTYPERHPESAVIIYNFSDFRSVDICKFDREI
jgi:hypothetical protein